MRRREVPARDADRVRRRTSPYLPLVLAVLAAAVRLPLLARPLSPDEGGFLLLAAQWAPGSSVYGDYWVDRPPLLIGLFGLADQLGGAVGLRVLGMVAVAASVVLAGAIGRVAAPGRRWAPTLTAATAAVFLSTPLFGTREVNGELLASPFVLGGLLAVFLAVAGRTTAWWAAAGVLAVCAMAVKQNMADVVVAGVIALAWQLRVQGVRRAAYGALAAVAGGAAAIAALLVWAELRGTEPRELWDAVVAFRFQAAAVISAAEPSSASSRLHGMLRAFVLSGAPLLFLLPLVPARRARERGCLPLVAAAVCLWEVFGVAGGGSYWWHYLVGLVPGLVLVVAAIARHRPGLQAAVALVLVCATVSGLLSAAAHPMTTGSVSEDERAADYVAAHARPGDTGLVAFGVPSILQKAGLHSPYEYIWSLPVRVRDPKLTELTGVLSGPHHPTWVVVSGASLDTWGVDATSAQQVLDARYRLVGVVGQWRFFHALDGHGTLTP
ncbi:hypothetical protein GCM10009798_37100 [Nocardioides panacihumi]|uniref:Glycosyltransferase RgtA/B/C/D-like domain-containing protein n=1 Tax=Nocardioides panacihumi TaxID=400774 RepID=A0ABN2RP69_9ACTN